MGRYQAIGKLSAKLAFQSHGHFSPSEVLPEPPSLRLAMTGRKYHYILW